LATPAATDFAATLPTQRQDQLIAFGLSRRGIAQRPIGSTQKSGICQSPT
jgi:hypothetical protein